MPDRSEEFREAVLVNQRTAIDSKPRRKVVRRRIRDDGDVWLEEAERVATHIRSLSTFLRSIRRAYLDLSSSSSAAKPSRPPRSLDLTKGLDGWQGIRWLNDRERDEVDFQAKLVLRRCMERIRELEGADKIRQAAVAAQRPPSLSRMLRIPQVPSPVDVKAEQVTAHRASITLYLNRLLAEVGKAQQAQQEARVSRQLDRSAAHSGLGSLVGQSGGVGMNDLGARLAGTRSEDRRLGKSPPLQPTSIFAADSTFIIPSTLQVTDQDNDDDNEDYVPIDELLTPAQVQMFEAEASSLLRTTEDQLASIKHAEASLLEISALQSELVTHLTQQAEVTDQLYEDAITVSGRVEEGNRQLRKARERNRESRLFLLVFLIGASLTLLFLDYY